MLPEISKRSWNRERAAHVLIRAGFSGAPGEIEALAKRSPQSVVDELLDFPAANDPVALPSWASEPPPAPLDGKVLKGLSDDEKQARRRAFRKLERQRLEELRAWWLYRMRYTQRPLQEKLTLFWHGHFATSAVKVRTTHLLYQQNQLFRRMAHGNWRDFLVAISKDPAMLVYLDNARSKKQAPNENYARELMELFSLGEGHYTEDDIKAAARAFTGWSVLRQDRSFVVRKRMHDDGPKRFFHQTGRFDGEDIVRIITEQSACAEFIMAKLWRFFAYEQPGDKLIYALADTLRNNRYEFKPTLRALFLSQAFYSARAYRTQVKSPVQWLVGASRQLEAPLPSGRACSAALRTLGQDLFAPPNVKGWDGGTAWITTATLLNRYNYAGTLVNGKRHKGQRLGTIMQPEFVLPPGERTSTETALTHLERRLFQSGLRARDRAVFRDYAAALPPAARWSEQQLGKVVHMMMSTPQYQLC